MEIGNRNISLDDVYFLKYALNANKVDELYNSQYASIEIPWCGIAYHFGIYPNPSETGNFKIVFANKVRGLVKIHVYDMLGKEIVRNQNHSNMIEFQLNEPPRDTTIYTSNQRV